MSKLLLNEFEHNRFFDFLILYNNPTPPSLPETIHHSLFFHTHTHTPYKHHDASTIPHKTIEYVVLV